MHGYLHMCMCVCVCICMCTLTCVMYVRTFLVIETQTLVHTQEEVTEVILKSAEDVRVMKRDLKNWQKLKTKEISDKLMKMNEEQCSMDQLMREREDCLEAVRTERNKLLVIACDTQPSVIDTYSRQQ